MKITGEKIPLISISQDINEAAGRTNFYKIVVNRKHCVQQAAIMHKGFDKCWKTSENTTTAKSLIWL